MIPFLGWGATGAKQIHHLIPKAVYRDFKNVIDPQYLLNHAKNLMELPVPFHGNHPQYSNYVREALTEMQKKGALSLDKMVELQKNLRNEIQSHLVSGTQKNLNDLYRK
jgi:hypothetical protein